MQQSFIEAGLNRGTAPRRWCWDFGQRRGLAGQVAGFLVISLGLGTHRSFQPGELLGHRRLFLVFAEQLQELLGSSFMLSDTSGE